MGKFLIAVLLLAGAGEASAQQFECKNCIPASSQRFTVVNRIESNNVCHVFTLEDEMKCVHCGSEINFAYLNKADLEKHQECFNCNHFMALLRRPDRSDCLVVKRDDIHGSPTCHYMYCPGGGRHAGFGGDKWLIEMTDGRKFETTNLWHQGHIPEHLLKHFPINAKLTNASLAGAN